MHHFTAVCHRYPSLTFNVPALRPLYDERGAKFESTVLRFIGGVFDSVAAGLTDQEAEAAHARLKAMKFMPPLYGEHIIAKEQEHENERRQNERRNRKGKENLAAQGDRPDEAHARDLEERQ